jgi:hypothetical protein
MGGLGFSPYPLMFYARSLVLWLYPMVTGQILIDRTAEYLSINALLGLVLIGGVLVTAVRRPSSDSTRFLAILFCVVFGFFSSILPGDTPKDLDPVSWIWVDVTMFAAVILTGAWLADASGRLRTIAWRCAGVALGFAVLHTMIS